MKITKSAVDQILETMDIMGMDPKEYFLLFSESNQGDCAIGFTKEGQPEIHDGLGVVCSIDMSNVTVDLIEVDGKKGLTFISNDF